MVWKIENILLMPEVAKVNKKDVYLVIHGHFYQPPRENPWLEVIEAQDSAYPFHDWNERIFTECYSPNTAARIMSSDGKIEDIITNYARISYDFGPTLMSWLAQNKPEIYKKIIEADRISASALGHGNAIAQVYNHIIMPLANRRDKVTQVIWGIYDFEYRFNRKPEGMWLSETAVDYETLEILASNGIKFTILSPYQAKRVRMLNNKSEWIDVQGGKIDPRQPYRCFLKNGLYIDIFFYDAPISRSIAFEGVLRDGEILVARLLNGYNPKFDRPVLINVATDGETYGHHHRFGDMALAYAIKKIERENIARITNYGKFLEDFPPDWEVEIIENTSWSCSHGVGRWYQDCGCSTGGLAGWNQQWRKPLRKALDNLRDRVVEIFESVGSEYLSDVWAARNDYIKVILNRNPEVVKEYFATHVRNEVGDAEKIKIIKLLEMQRHAMLMYTSCGWFFTEISGIETVQILKYAARCIQLAMEFNGRDIEKDFLDILSQAKSNIPEFRDGAYIYKTFVTPFIVNLRKVVAHYAISSLFEDYPQDASIYCFSLERLDYRKISYGPATLAIGRVKVSSDITLETQEMIFVVLHFGGHDFRCSVRGYMDIPIYEEMKSRLFEVFSQKSLTELVRVMDEHLGRFYYTLKHLFLDKRRMILSIITSETLNSFVDTYFRLYDENVRLMEYLKDVDMPIPDVFKVAAEFTLSKRLEQEVARLEGEYDSHQYFQAIRIMQEAKKWNCKLDTANVEAIFQRMLLLKMNALVKEPNREICKEIMEIFRVIAELGINLNLWDAQNIFFSIKKEYLPRLIADIEKDNNEQSKKLLESLLELGEMLNINVGEYKKRLIY